jgi:hypothetical protein
MRCCLITILLRRVIDFRDLLKSAVAHLALLLFSESGRCASSGYSWVVPDLVILEFEPRLRTENKLQSLGAHFIGGSITIPIFESTTGIQSPFPYSMLASSTDRRNR